MKELTHNLIVYELQKIYEALTKTIVPGEYGLSEIVEIKKEETDDIAIIEPNKNTKT